MLKRIILLLYFLLIVCMGAATVIEDSKGIDFSHLHIYGSWWFSLLWTILLTFSVIYFLKQKIRNWGIVALHLSFVIILLGAFLTHVSSRQGMVHLRQGKTTHKYMVTDTKKGMVEKELPFGIRLDTFKIEFHAGTSAVADYISDFTILDGTNEQKGVVSMNNIYSHHYIRLYQNNFDEDMKGSYLSLNNDPYGIPVTYAGYVLLFITLIWMLLNPRGTFRKLLSSPTLRKSQFVLLAIILSTTATTASESEKELPHSASVVFPQPTAEKFGNLHLLYNNRICPVQTFAIDFTKKLYGKRKYNGYSAEQVLSGFIFWREHWNKEPIIKLKPVVSKRLSLPKYVSLDTFFDEARQYRLGPYVQEYYQGNNDKFHQEIAKIDDKLRLIFNLRYDSPLKVFPVSTNKSDFHTGQTILWFSSTNQLPDDIEPERAKYIQSIFNLVQNDAALGKTDEINVVLDKMYKYQLRYGGSTLPAQNKIKAEKLYNAIPFGTILFMFNLTVGFLSLFYLIFKLTRQKETQRQQPSRWVSFGSFALLFLSFATLTLCLGLRWIIKGTIPMANGYETMLLLAWFVLFFSLLLYRKVPILFMFGFLLSGFFLLVSHISQMDPQITPMMPVLASPLLSIHVSVIMMAYALLSLTFFCSFTTLLLWLFGRKDKMRLQENQKALMTLSQIFLYPAMTTLGIGIFVGAIWANVSWGNYWSWDPKEVWALITFMVYALPIHQHSITWLQKPRNFHLFMAVAFLVVLMTYFGVNYLLGGLHSYAGN